MSQEVDSSVDTSKQEVAVDLKALAKQLEEVRSKNERLESESKKYKTNFYSLKEEIEKKEREKLEKEKDFEKLLQMERTGKSELEEQLMKEREYARNVKRTALKSKLDAQIAMHAKDAKRIDHVMKLIPKDMIKIDEDTLEISGVEEAINYMRKDSPEYFGNAKTTGMTSGRPSFEIPSNDFDSLAEVDQHALFIKELTKNF